MERHRGNAVADSAMTEVALALAMGFFAIMVLTVVSMGAGDAASRATGAAPAALSVVETKTARMAGRGQSGQDNRIVIYFQGRFMDADLNPIDISGLGRTGRVVLAVPPDLPMAKALAVRSRINNPDLVVATLTGDWMKTLRRMK